MRPVSSVSNCSGSTCGSSIFHWRVQYSRTASRPWTCPPSIPFAHSTLGCIRASTASMFRALNSRYASISNLRSPFMIRLLGMVRGHQADIGQITIALGVVHAVANDEEIGNREAHVVRIDFFKTPRRLV